MLNWTRRLRLNDSRMRRTDFLNGLNGVLRESIPGVRTKEGKPICLAQDLPQAFKFNHSAVMALGPEQGDHFTKGPHAPTVPLGAHQQVMDDLLEKLFLRPASDHEL